MEVSPTAPLAVHHGAGLPPPRRVEGSTQPTAPQDTTAAVVVDAALLVLTQVPVVGHRAVATARQHSHLVSKFVDYSVCSAGIGKDEGMKGFHIWFGNLKE
jgi:hypothetical protein